VLRRAELGGHVAPGLGQQRFLGALAALEGGEQAALAHLAVLDVLGQLRRRSVTQGRAPGRSARSAAWSRRSESM